MKTAKNEEKTYNSDLTQHDKDILNQKNIHKDGGADEQLRDRKKEVDFTGSDLDVPTGEKTTEQTTGLKDEENRLYSQGGSRNNNLEEQKGEL
ncbi:MULTISPECIES: hypothetical protein [unclassified Leeuwenhoekiella]|uniref:hypothetical protein n=1 Tax=unclassified Leeuwenhoekiella TaxID=2615029 RepID=UPI000C3C1C0E|nr:MULTISPECIES: hypothetical protein [unclassified Leeuwenhoekiella]MAW94558.1 hypothetical protein [Leeuwenhoekiella sp.]MBA81981.1 hypothetical protein [Leeuwenhoekiella sp.]|tara:strand:- start:45022 stop:45300 length:279 start_codon:yes stop_codon:yes gene_type:complete